nr:hypothetical protein [Tanacetum cinerariifolium]
KVYSDHKIVEVKLCYMGKSSDYQLGIESIQIKINLTAQSLTVRGIENLELYAIITEPSIGIVYQNKKNQRRLMGLKDISKFCDATLEKVLKEVYVLACVAFYELKELSLDELDKDFIELFEKEIKKHLKHRRQMRM